MLGRIVRLTPKGLLVSPRQRATAFARSSGLPAECAVMNPSAPALATAAMSSALPTRVMPPQVIGASTPNISVNRVFTMDAPRVLIAFSPRVPVDKASTQEVSGPQTDRGRELCPRAQDSLRGVPRARGSIPPHAGRT